MQSFGTSLKIKTDILLGKTLISHVVEIEAANAARRPAHQAREQWRSHKVSLNHNWGLKK